MFWCVSKIEGGRRRGQQRMRRLDGITDSMDISLSKHREIVKGVGDGQGGLACCMQFMGSQTVGHD